MWTAEPGRVRPRSVNWPPTCAPGAGERFMIVFGLAPAEVRHDQPVENVAPALVVPVTLTLCVPGTSSKFGVTSKPFAFAYTALVTSRPSMLTCSESRLTASLKVACSAGVVVFTVAPLAGDTPLRWNDAL